MHYAVHLVLSQEPQNHKDTKHISKAPFKILLAFFPVKLSTPLIAGKTTQRKKMIN